MVEILQDGPFTIIQDELVYGIFGGRQLGNVDPRFGDAEQALSNRRIAISKMIGRSSLMGSRAVVMVPTGLKCFLDLERHTELDDYPITDGLITTKPEVIISGNPADCEMIAMYGHGEDGNVLGLFHASRRIANEDGHLEFLEYLNGIHGLKPEDTRLIFAPSVRAESYKFPSIDSSQMEDPKWSDFMYRDSQDFWHVDTHGRVKHDLIEAGVSPENIYASQIDVGSSADYFSHRQFVENGQERGRNAVMFRIV